MSLLHSVETETLLDKPEIVKEETSEGMYESSVTSYQIECDEEEFEDLNKNIKLEDDIFLKEEIKEFIDDQFDPKYDRCFDKFQYISPLCDKINVFKNKPKEELKEVEKNLKTVHSIHSGFSEIKVCDKVEPKMVYSDWKQEEVKSEEHSPYTKSPVFTFSTYDELPSCEERVDFNKEHMEHESMPSQELSAAELSCSDNPQFELTHDLKFHTLKEHNKQLSHHCTVCRDSFKLKQDLKQHKCHVLKNSLKAKEKAYPCSECPAAFRLLRELKVHLKGFHTRDKLRCCYCSLTFNKKSALKSHLSSHKGVVKLDHECEVCGRVFKFQSNLIRHMKIHTGHKPYGCETCGKGFSRLDHLKVHKRMRKHEDLVKESGHAGSEAHPDETEEFVCEICGLGFRIKQRLRDHLKLHTENRPHVCKVCNRAFKQIYNLKQHVLSHDGPRDFICDVCNKGFRRKAFLKQHMLVHTKEKKYVCEICGKRYYKSCHVADHKKKAHGPKIDEEIESITKKRRPNSRKVTVTCDSCNKVFHHKSALAQHVLTHLG